MIEEERICMMNTPLVEDYNKKGEPVNWYFSLDSYNKSSHKHESKYYKGLGSFNKNDLQKIIEKEGGMENLLVSFSQDKKSEFYLKEWMDSSQSSSRKTFLEDRVFNLSTV